MNVEDLRGKTALVTGAASGIGQAIAIALAERGADLFLCTASNMQGLAETRRRIETCGRRVVAAQIDVSQAAQVSEFARTVHQQVDAVDIIVSNAGVGLLASFLETSDEDWNWVLDTNLRGCISILQHFVPPLVKAKRGGHVVVVASVASFVASGASCAYATSKFALLGLAESMRANLKAHGIGVTALCPGIVRTSMNARSRMAQPAHRAAMEAFFDKNATTPEVVARAALRAIALNQGVATVGPGSALYWMKRLWPGIVPHITQRFEQKISTAAAGTTGAS
jgi:NAD(P)-dependent dehydrogenase (short-subunit alcohol dehydrogenase family)